MSDAQDLKPAQCDLSRELRVYNALNNHIGAERMMKLAADALDDVVNALSSIASRNPLNADERKLMDLALAKTELP